ncbi:MAG TPA: acyltransferase [Staphylococcus ureilyticus]|uniref:acyltransferase family protein n=1 Tax=Staphylococcus ureilyticus TaxID=94138 RepID=UPI001E17E241|nr:acyltransferase [Staphylococcus ureilyticus]HJG68264.1 acyltransferase [Staphylococcus ureilyticus]
MFSWGSLSRYRNELFGLSIIEILIFHFFENYFDSSDGIKGILYYLGKAYDLFLGSIGVEVFLFLSGMGLYYSLKKRKDNSIINFYKRRFKRLLPSFITVAILYYAWRNFIYTEHGFYGFIRGIFFIDFFKAHDTTYWFILLILIMYILFPYLYSLLNDSNAKRNINLVFVIFIWLVACIIIYFNKKLFINIEILLMRIPIFILGLYFGDIIMNDKKLTKYTLLVLLIIVMLKLLLIKESEFPIVGRIIASGWTFPIMFFGVFIIKNVASNIGILNRFIRYSGSLSLELYIVHVSLREFLNAYGFTMSILWHYLIMIVLSYFFATVIKKLQGYFIS